MLHAPQQGLYLIIYGTLVYSNISNLQRPLLERVLAKATGRQIAVYATVNDQYELCLTKCRTNSHSVQNENKYRDPKLKHCYGETEEQLTAPNSRNSASGAVDTSDNNNPLVNSV